MRFIETTTPAEVTTPPTPLSAMTSKLLIVLVFVLVSYTPLMMEEFGWSYSVLAVPTVLTVAVPALQTWHERRKRVGPTGGQGLTLSLTRPP